MPIDRQWGLPPGQAGALRAPRAAMARGRGDPVLGGCRPDGHRCVRARSRLMAGLVALAAAGGWTGATLGLAGIVAGGWPAVLDARGQTPDAVVSVLAAALGLLICVWLGLGTVTSLAAALLDGRPGGHIWGWLARRTAPRVLRRAVVLAVGLALTGVVVPAVAAPLGPSGRVDPAAARLTDRDLDPSWLPTGGSLPAVTGTAPLGGPADRPATGRAGASAAAPGAPVTAAPTASAPITRGPGGPSAPGEQVAAPSGSGNASASVPTPPSAGIPSGPGRTRAPADEPTVLVRRGDSLWALAARRLGPGASIAEIAAEWPRWYVVNRAVIGPDPDRLRPGQRLTPPPARTAPVAAPSTGRAR